MRVDIESIILECAETVSHFLGDPSLQDSFATMCFDSLDMVDFVMEVEDAFDLEIDDDAAMSWVTLQDTVDYVKSVLT
jgi:acyl carrier protein